MGGSSYYGLASALSDMDKGYEAEEDRQAKQAQAAQQGEVNSLKLKKLRGELEKENSAEAIKLLLRGDVEGAMKKYNEAGAGRMSELEVDEEEGLVSWLDGEGNQQAAMLPHLMALAGINPKDLDTPDAAHGRKMEQIEHTAKMKKKYGLDSSGKVPSKVQIAEWIKNNLTNENGSKMTANEAWKMATAGTYSRERLIAQIYGQIQKADEYGELSEEEIQDMVEARMRAIDALGGKKEAMPGPSATTGGAPKTGTIDRGTGRNTRPWR